MTSARPHRRIRAIASFATVLAVATVATACGADDPTEGGGDAELTVVATTTQAADLVRNVGGRRVAVRTLLRPNADPHDYEPRPSDVRALSGADLIVRSGGELDGWLGELVSDAGGDAPTVTLDRHVRRRGDDPHWWQDPRNAIRAVAAIRAALDRADPDTAAVFAANASAYAARLRRLDRSVATCLGRLPAARRRLVTTHDALGYYAARYDLEVLGSVIPSASTQAQPSARDLRTLVGRIRRAGVRAIFPEQSLAPRVERAVAAEAGARVGDRLWTDTLGPAGTPGATYTGSIEANTRAIAAGLSGGRVRCFGRA